MELPRIAEQAGRQQEPPLRTRLLKRCLHVSVGAPPRVGTGCDFTHGTVTTATILSRDPRRPPPRAAHPGPGDGWSCPGSDAAGRSPCDAGLAPLAASSLSLLAHRLSWRLPIMLLPPTAAGGPSRRWRTMQGNPRSGRKTRTRQTPLSNPRTDWFCITGRSPSAHKR